MLSLTEIKLNINTKEKRIRVQEEGSCVCFIKAYACSAENFHTVISGLVCSSDLLVPLKSYLFL